MILPLMLLSESEKDIISAPFRPESTKYS